MKKVQYGKIEVIELPSGYKVRARKPSLTTMLAAGAFPTELTDMVWNLITTGNIHGRIRSDKVVGAPEKAEEEDLRTPQEKLAAEEAAKNPPVPEVIPELPEQSPDLLRRLSGIIDSYVLYTVVSPRIVPKDSKELTVLEEDDEGILHGVLRVDEMQDLDKWKLYSFGQTLRSRQDEVVAPGLARFSGDGAGNAAPPAGGDVPPASVDPGRDRSNEPTVVRL